MFQGSSLVEVRMRDNHNHHHQDNHHRIIISKLETCKEQEFTAYGNWPWCISWGELLGWRYVFLKEEVVSRRKASEYKFQIEIDISPMRVCKVLVEGHHFVAEGAHHILTTIIGKQGCIHSTINMCTYQGLSVPGKDIFSPLPIVLHISQLTNVGRMDNPWGLV